MDLVQSGHGLLAFDDGRMWRIAGDGTVLVGGRRVPVDTVQPGTVVTVDNGVPVAFENGQYAPLASGAAVNATVTSVRQTITGRITSVRGDTIKVRGDDGYSYKIRLPSAAAVAKGDLVRIDVSVSPLTSNSPSALPR